MHDTPAGHSMPQPPQFRGSESGRTHCDPQRSFPPGQAQLPVRQFCPEAHAWPHLPQLALSEERLTQAPLQLVRPPAQPFWQLPPEHAMFWAQAFAQRPQFFGSLLRSTHAFAQSVRPGQLLSGDRHRPVRHSRPIGQSSSELQK
jgi:hypothetical protein